MLEALDIFLNVKFEVGSESPDSAVGIATGYGLDDRGVGVRSPGRVKVYAFTTAPRPNLGPTQPPIQCLPEALSPG
jgi:hypothetical protein